VWNRIRGWKVWHSETLSHYPPIDIIPQIFDIVFMESLHKPIGVGRMEIPVGRYDGEKVSRIREKIECVFGSACTLDDKAMLKKYNITSDGDLIMFLR
jgi:hypothetical protein